MNQPLSCQSIVSSGNPEVLVREIMTKLIYLMKGKCDIDIIIYSETVLTKPPWDQLHVYGIDRCLVYTR